MNIYHEFKIFGYILHVRLHIQKKDNQFDVEVPKTYFRDLTAFLLGGKSEVYIGHRITHSYIFPNIDAANHFCFLLGLKQKTMDDYIPF